jgi:hypothetical protein
MLPRRPTDSRLRTGPQAPAGGNAGSLLAPPGGRVIAYETPLDVCPAWREASKGSAEARRNRRALRPALPRADLSGAA